ncbi:glycosyltransferase family 2 protein [Microbacterium sp. C7(2022)]|uniref:glycosyltransferase family 2 protein n=1 Tax=Microbacterium sp. C7(2022) TaxID=2992759 RepID=UPI00237B37AA|nr:glycosyltransferase family 2 protein [Microbacterium sp. C7(2022)]MDE0547323.1 glycosyltransferase family 2 protein [Microbacterium sp. C7(2022)]
MRSDFIDIGISVVIPMYRVAEYLPDLLRSMSRQRVGGYRLQIVFVDDGSPDDCAALARDWLAASDHAGTVIVQENAGVSAARNAGIDAAHEEWVTFPDSDDYLADDYFFEIAQFIRVHGEKATIVSARLLRLMEPAPTPQNVHALSFRFAGGNRVVPMEKYPDFFQLNVASAFFRTAEVRRYGLRFAAGLHASEDALFTAAFLLTQREPSLGLVASTSYVYRRRAAADSAVDQFRENPRTYIDRFRDGYAPLLERTARSGTVPDWLQSMFLYETQWILPVQLDESRRAVVLTEALQKEALGALAMCARHVTRTRLFEYDATALPMESRLLLLAITGRALPEWLGAYRAANHAGGKRFTYSLGEPSVISDARGRPISSRDWNADYPDYFGQRVLSKVFVGVAGEPDLVVDGVRRREFKGRGRYTESQLLDEHRRAATSSTPRALPAKTGEVRVWKPVVGPNASIRTRVMREVRLARRRWKRWRRGGP